MKKRFLAIIAVILCMFSFSCNVFAAQTPRSYTFGYTQGEKVKLRLSSNPYNPTSGYRPYVNPSASSTITRYYLVSKDVIDDGDVIPAATNYLSVSTAGKKYFTYNTGYGGTGEKYYLGGYPLESGYYSYTIGGTWAP